MAAIAQVKNLDTDIAGCLDASHNALRAEDEVVNLEADLELIPNHAIAAGLWLNETAVEAYIEDAPFAEIPTLNAEIDWALTAMTRNSPPFLTIAIHEVHPGCIVGHSAPILPIYRPWLAIS